MKFTDIQNLSESELQVKKRELEKTLFETKMKNSMGQVTNPLVIRHTRRDIARLNTALNDQRRKKQG